MSNGEETNVPALRRAIYGKSSVSRDDVADLLRLARAGSASASAEFGALLAEAATDLLVNQVDPPRYIQPGDADWLIACLGENAGVSSHLEYRMLTEIIRQAVSVPPRLAAFAVGEIRKAIIEGHATADGAPDHVRGVVTAEDVESLRIAVFAATEGSSLHVTRESAEALFDIADATADAANDSAFDDFFAKAVGNYLMGVAFHWTPSVADERDLEKWLDQKPSLGSFLSSMFGGGARDDSARFGEAGFARENAVDAAEAAVASQVDANETTWLLERLQRDGKISSAEQKLLRFIAGEASTIDPRLRQLIDQEAA